MNRTKFDSTASIEADWLPVVRFQIVVLPGDGIGGEVVAEGVKVLRAVESRLNGVTFQLREHFVGAAEFLRSGDPLPAEAFRACQEADAVLLGPTGLPNVRWLRGGA